MQKITKFKIGANKILTLVYRYHYINRTRPAFSVFTRYSMFM